MKYFFCFSQSFFFLTIVHIPVWLGWLPGPGSEAWREQRLLEEPLAPGRHSPTPGSRRGRHVRRLNGTARTRLR